MRTAYRVLAYLLALSVAAQASLIAFGAFALENNIDNGPVSDGDTTGVTLHHSFAYVVLLCAVALLAVSFGAKVPHGVRLGGDPARSGRGAVLPRVRRLLRGHHRGAARPQRAGHLRGRAPGRTPGAEDSARSGAIGLGRCSGLNVRAPLSGAAGGR